MGKHKLQTSVFLIHEEISYRNSVSIKLELDYQLNKVSIIPLECISKKREFGFVNGDARKLKYWKSIINAISSAIELAEKELSINQPSLPYM